MRKEKKLYKDMFLLKEKLLFFSIIKECILFN